MLETGKCKNRSYFIAGIPVSIVAASNKYQNEVITSASQYMQSRTLLLCFSLVIHYLTCITTERYLKITSRTQKISARHSKRIVAIVTVYVFSLSSIIILNDLCLLPNLTCSNKLWFLYKQTRTDGFSKNSTVSTAYSGNPAYGGSSQVPVIITTMWMTICNTVLNTTTVATVRFIKKSVRNMEKSIGTSTKRFETRRLKIVYALSTFFSILWIPYGVINGQQEKLDPKVKKALHILMETYCYASFVAIPLAIYIMDKRFASFIKSFLRRG